MKTKFFHLLILLFIATVSCSQQNTSNIDNPISTQTFVSKWHNFTIEFPSNWKAEKQPDENNIYFIGPSIDSALFKQDGTFGIKVFALPEAYTSEYTCNINMGNFATDPTFQDFKIESQTEIFIDGKKAIRVIYTARVSNIETISLQYYLTVGKKLFILGGSVPASKLGKYEHLYDHIIKSMKFK
jgi:hypothetical protein